MDISKDYILMCSKATEIQNMRSWTILTESYNLESNDFYFGFHPLTEQDEVIYESLSTFRQHNIKAWIPRQDQLQDMVKGKVMNKLRKFFEFVNSSTILFHVNYLDDTLEQFTSMEQLWLSYVMKENYNKIWDSEKQDWIKQNKQTYARI